MYINNKFTHMLLPYYYTDGDKIISTFDNNSTLHQNLAVFFGTLDLWDCITLKTELAVIDNRFTHSPSEYRHHTTLRAAFDATYKWKKLMVTAGFKSKEKELITNGILSESYNSWRGSVRYNTPNWLFEVGVENLFSHANYLHQSFISEVYSYKSAIYNRMSQSNVYVKITYRLNRGKKQKITGMDTDESQSSAILK
ncbi:MAG: hypothetical protein K2K86_08990 [Muribaculaceae bacterium]|nr:hypothetical protein [Muribaculaceae bacterium]